MSRGILICMGALLLLCSCARHAAIPVAIEDNPTHHYLQGLELIDQGDIDGAKRRFTRALELDRDFSPALAGQGLVAAVKAYDQRDVSHRQVETKKALDFLSQCRSKTRGSAEKFIYQVTAIRIHTRGQSKDWLSDAVESYEAAINLDPEETSLPYYQSKPAAHYFMGHAYWQAGQFRKVEDLLDAVIAAKPGKWHDSADKLYKKVQKIARAVGHYTLTNVSKMIAVQEQVVRGDVAALLADELHLDRFLAGRIPVKSRQPQTDFVPTDAVDHIFKDEIIVATKWNLRGLQAQYDQPSRAYLFKPLTPVKRKELALILEDLLIKITGDKLLSKAFYGRKRSSYPDVSPSAPWYNAVENAVTRGLMEADLSGEFRPDDFVNGAELLLAVMKLRNVMNIH